MGLLELMLKRRSIRKYTGEAIPDERIEQILQVGLLSISSRNLKPWEFIVVRDKEKLTALSKAKKAGAGMLEHADCAIVVVGDRDRSDVWIEDCAIAMTYMHLMATELGLGSCWVQYRLRQGEAGDSEAYIRELLGIPENYGVLAVLSIGVAAQTPKGHTLDELQWEKVHRETF